MGRQIWRDNKTTTTLKMQQMLREAILNRTDVQIALGQYINSFNLQGQINAKIMTPQEAAQRYIIATSEFEKNLQATINATFSQDKLDQTDAEKFADAIANPNSLVSENMNTAASIEDDINSQSAINDETNTVAQSFIQEAETQTKLLNEQTQISSQTNTTVDDIEKGAAVAACIKVVKELDHVDPNIVANAEKTFENSFQKITGHTIKFNELEKTSDHKAAEGSHAPVPRPVAKNNVNES